ncbi:hypothetical protein [Puniceibacterium antarcticum]|uniref:hypothetical protein n=1 Tax=Puniceibacterium antarcticum TaxID=1206336 RepID=UPI001FE49E2C|nr:hypothetical protein [Puniceibacterium antarcticum]
MVCSDWTPDGIGEPTVLPALLDEIDAPINLLMADGAYEGEPRLDLLTERFGDQSHDPTSKERGPEARFRPEPTHSS